MSPYKLALPWPGSSTPCRSGQGGLCMTGNPQARLVSCLPEGGLLRLRGMSGLFKAISPGRKGLIHSLSPSETRGVLLLVIEQICIEYLLCASSGGLSRGPQRRCTGEAGHVAGEPP